MPSFDLDRARSLGKSDSEITDFLAGKLGEQDKVQRARAAGHSDADILSKLMQRMDTSAPSAPLPTLAPEAPAAPLDAFPTAASPAAPVPAAIPEPDLSTLEKLGDLGKKAARSIAEHRLEPLFAILQTPINPGISYDYLYGHGLDDNLAKYPTDPNKAFTETVRQNAADAILTTFDFATLGIGSAAFAPIRELAAKAGLSKALSAITAAGIEGGGYLGTYDALESALEGHSIGEVAKDAVKGVGIGIPIGVGGGIAGLGMERLLKFIRDSRIEKEIAAQAVAASAEKQQAFEAAKATIAEQNPHLNEEVVDNAAAKTVFHGEQPELPPPPTPPKPAEGQSVRGVPRTAADPEEAAAFGNAISTANERVFEPVKIVERATTIPFAGPEKLRPFFRATEGEVRTVRDVAKDTAHFFQGAFVPEPGASNVVKDLIFRARTRMSTAPDAADHIIDTRVFRLLQGTRREIGKKTAILSEYMHGLDRVSTLRSKGAAQIPIEGIGTEVARGAGGATLPDLEEATASLRAVAEQHPDVVQAQKAVRNLLDEVMDVYMEYGLMEKGQFGTGVLPRYRRDYLPAHRLYEVATGLQRQFAGTAIGKELSAVLERNSAGEIIETNIVKILRPTLAALNRKIAEVELWRAIEADPSLNFTHLFKEGDQLPKGYKLYMPGPGQPGFAALDAQEEAYLAAMRGLPIPRDRFIEGAYVLESDLADRLTNFYQRPGSELEQTLYNLARKFNRHLTLYSPSNMPINVPSDLSLALLGLPGEKSDLFGVLRFYPSSLKESLKGAFGKESELFEFSMREGLTSGTFTASLGGETVPARLEAAMAQGHELTRKEKVVDFLNNWVRLRQATELAPRMAAGRAAVARSGNVADFARVGQQSTLAFGAGDPAISRSPIMSILAPFWRWTGMATSRTAALATTKGSRARGLAALAVPAGVAALWNLQNKEYRQVELSLGEYDHNHMHIILPDPRDPMKPLRKKNGQPMVWRMRFWVPEEIMGLMGMGNLPGRLFDVAHGRTGPGDFVKESAGEVGQTVASLPASVLSTVQLLTGKSTLTGEQMETFERAETTLPITYHFGKFLETAYNEGVGQAVLQGGPRLIGIRPAGARLGRADARIAKLNRELKEAEMRGASAGAKGDRFRAQYYAKKAQRLRLSAAEAAAARQEILRSEQEQP